MAQFQTKRMVDATQTATFNSNEYLLKVDINNVLTRINKTDFLSGTDLECIHSVPGGVMDTNGKVGEYVATPRIAGDQAIRFILFACPAYGSPDLKQGMVIQEVSNTRTTQYMYWNGSIFVRAVYFADASRSVVAGIGAWQASGMPTGFKAEGNVVKMKCVHGDAFGGEIPLASTSNAGLLSSADKALLDKLRAKNLV